MIDWNRVGDATGFLDTTFLSLLNKNFIDDPNHLTGIRMVKRTTAVAWVGGRVELENLVGRDQPGESFFLQLLPGQLGNDDRCDR